jgi:hypothetical protein
VTDDNDYDDDDNDGNDDDGDDIYHNKKLRLIFYDSLEFVELNYTKMRSKIKLLSINLCM